MRRQVFDSANELNESLLYIDECSLSYAKLVEKHERTKKFSFVFQKTAQYALYQPHTFLRSKPRFHRFSNKACLQTGIIFF